MSEDIELITFSELMDKLITINNILLFGQDSSNYFITPSGYLF